MALTISQLRAFTAIAEHGSIRAASRALGIAQSGITQQLQNLESMLGATLFTRTNRGIALTALGQRLLQRAGAIIGECERAEQEVRQLRGDYIGEVTFGMTTEPLVDAFAPVLMEFRSRFERVAVHLRTGTSRMMISWIREGSLDFAVALVSKHTDTADLSVTPLYASDPVIVCRQGHPKAGATSLAELVDCTWAATRSPNLTDDPQINRLSHLFESHGLPPPKIVATVEGLYETLHLVGATDCLSLEASVVAKRGPFASTLTSIDVRERAVEQNVCLLQRAAIPLTPAAQELATMIASYTRTVRAR
ncbi:LysR substrate-binding domain-containing protein [Paraburkholderia sp. 22099]|jgi:molybdate transport repressor ModE-like protein|uniref:Transcriptional regulator, LysR family n=1 Tax=Paraburkholderia terricola TaxID=169427 RepID=A0A1M6QRZ9_9BURK|nr:MULTISPECIES: LysR substrate-binding domain-containing protein [Paraburkholderia]ORC52208.1 LysR family transcriptional regulator [Burkholderia sp. A27]AXE95278.1 LysR family transcriptional regulator [Paraburkholderia terricola]MDR6443921.1 molybdate transport repressor ModE-like protein [Paraburkholderia terricola]MDR6496510.1 molybdate transport repressor ModE-like protein [Paraburkholderia terricola]SDO38371.1 transcriptional regulator, LysR family [Paraburkholderia sediminicola]